MLRLALWCASRRAAHSRACKSQATATLCGVEVVDATRTTVGSRRLARGGVIRGSLGRWASHERSRDVSANHARAERGGGRPLRGQLLWLHTRPTTLDGFGDTGFGVTVAPDEDFRPRAPRGARSSLSAGVIGTGVLVFGLGAAVGALVSGVNPLASTIAQVRRPPYPPPRDTPHAAPRADSAPPRARPPVPSPDPTDRSLERTHSTLLFFSPPGSPPDSVSPNPPRSPASRRKSRRTSVSRARPRSRRPPSVTSSPPPTATRSIHPASRRSPAPGVSRVKRPRSLRIWRTISRQIPRRCGQSASPDAGPRAQPGVPPSATWATG